MDFKNRLFESLSVAMPNLTTREFSSLCGKSEGYFGSLTAQKLSISDNALLYLSEHLELKKQVVDDKQFTARVNAVQELIAQEIARRMNELQVDNLRVRQMILRSVAKIAVQKDQTENLPFMTHGFVL
jgi:hypothetical protein